MKPPIKIFKKDGSVRKVVAAFPQKVKSGNRTITKKVVRTIPVDATYPEYNGVFNNL